MARKKPPTETARVLVKGKKPVKNRYKQRSKPRSALRVGGITAYFIGQPRFFQDSAELGLGDNIDPTKELLIKGSIGPALNPFEGEAYIEDASNSWWYELAPDSSLGSAGYLITVAANDLTTYGPDFELSIYRYYPRLCACSASFSTS